MKKLICAMAALILAANASAAPASDWLPVRETSLALSPSSPLDFSGFLGNEPITAATRLVIGARGRIARADKPNTPVPLYCASLAWSHASGGFPDHAQADIYAAQLAMRGYNLARFHFLDGNLMAGRTKDFDLDPQTLDRVHYLMAALKRHGIHWMVDGITSWRGGLGNHDDRWSPSPGLRLEINFEEKAFQHWKQLVTSIFSPVNPYTGIAPIKDDALAVLILANENGMEFETVVQDKPGRAYPENMRRAFNTWLKTRYANTQALAKAWPDLKPDERIETGTIRMPGNRYEPNPRMRDIQAFFVETEKAATVRMTREVRNLGYRGIVSNYNNWATVQTGLTRSALQAVTMNTYHDGADSYEPGSKIHDQSSLADALLYVRRAAASRWLGKPFILSEYDHVFWNRHRYESGLAMPAYAAYQGWDGICRHAHGPIALRYGEPFAHKRAILPYALSLDPVARAGETLAALLFRRGDVAQSRASVPFKVRGPEDLSNSMQAAEPDALTRLALISSIGLRQDEAAGAGSGDEVTVNQPRDSADALKTWEKLKATGRLPAGNRTDPARGLYESDTGEILADVPRQRLTLSTARTEAVAFSSVDTPIILETLRIERATVPALFAVSAIDGAASLKESKRMLLIFTPDARNSRMRFRDRQEKVIEDFGSLPVLIRKGAIEAQLIREAHWRLSPVSMDGKTGPPLASGAGPIRFRLSNETPSGPAIFFLLETD